MLWLLGMCSGDDGASAVGHMESARIWSAHASERDTAPFRSMFAVATDDVERVRETADVGLYVVFQRIIKRLDDEQNRAAPRVIATFPMVRHAERSHADCDAHWRDLHGPLALRSHLAMCDYEQFSVVATLQGSELDGVAMCAFPDRQTLSDKFFNDDEAKAAIAADVASFANTRTSWPRVVLTERP